MSQLFRRHIAPTKNSEDPQARKTFVPEESLYVQKIKRKVAAENKAVEAKRASDASFTTLLKKKAAIDVTCFTHFNPTPRNLNTYIFFDNFALKREAIINDLFVLLADFLMCPTRNFSSFKAVWVKRQFSLIHFGCPERGQRGEFMNAVYQSLLTFLYEEAVNKFPSGPIKPLELKLAIIFGLYLIYFTQPNCFAKAKIQIDQGQWGVLHELYQVFGSMNNVDGIYAFGKLKEEGAFSFSAHINHMPFYYQQQRLRIGGNIPEPTPNENHPLQPVANDLILRNLDNQLKDVESSVLETTLGGLALDSVLGDVAMLEDEYESKKSHLKIMDAGSNHVWGNSNYGSAHIHSFRQWLSHQNQSANSLSVAAYLNSIITSHNDFRKEALLPKPRSKIHLVSPNHVPITVSNPSQISNSPFETDGLDLLASSSLMVTDPYLSGIVPSIMNDVGSKKIFDSSENLNALSATLLSLGGTGVNFTNASNSKTPASRGRKASRDSGVSTERSLKSRSKPSGRKRKAVSPQLQDSDEPVFSRQLRPRTHVIYNSNLDNLTEASNQLDSDSSEEFILNSDKNASPEPVTVGRPPLLSESSFLQFNQYENINPHQIGTAEIQSLAAIDDSSSSSESEDLD